MTNKKFTFGLMVDEEVYTPLLSFKSPYFVPLYISLVIVALFSIGLLPFLWGIEVVIGYVLILRGIHVKIPDKKR